MKHALLLAATLALAGCGDGAAKGDADKIAATISGDAKGAAADNPRCKMFSQAEIAALSGEPMDAGRNAAGGLGCQWPASDGSGSAIVTVAPESDHVETSGADGYRELKDVGSKGYVAGGAGGWTAAAIAKGKSIDVSIDSDKTSEANVVSLLTQAIARAGQ